MKYQQKSCPTCGCENLKEISTTSGGGNQFCTYKCPACGETISTYETYLRKEQAEAEERKRKEEAELERKRQAEEEARKLAESEAAKKIVPLSAKEVFKLNIDNTVEILCSDGINTFCGSGSMLGNGYIITNLHVVSQTVGGHVEILDEIYVRSDNIAKTEAEFIYADSKKDLALLYSEGLNGKTEVCKEPVEIGDKIYVIGNSKGEGICIIDGLVSDKERRLGGQKYIMISAPTTHGNSGGPVFNDKGQLVGVVKMGRTDVQSMNYAIPISAVIEFIDDARDKEEIDLII